MDSHERLPREVSEAEVVSAVDEINGDPVISGVLVLRPLPEGVPGAAVCGALDPLKERGDRACREAEPTSAPSKVEAVSLVPGGAVIYAKPPVDVTEAARQRSVETGACWAGTFERF